MISVEPLGPSHLYRRVTECVSDFFFFFLLERGSYHVTQASLKHLIIIPQATKNNKQLIFSSAKSIHLGLGESETTSWEVCATDKYNYPQTSLPATGIQVDSRGLPTAHKN